MIDEAVGKLIEFLQSASPMVWQALIKQVYVEAFARLAWVVGFILVGFFFLRLFNVYDKKISESEFEEEDWDKIKTISSILVLVCIFISFYLFISSLMWLVNPEFYAIRYILEQIK